MKPEFATGDRVLNKRIEIGGHAVGSGNPPLIVAEMSGNHNGHLERALDIVKAAAAAGAHAIKLQTFRASTLTVDSKRAEFFIDDPGGAWHGRRLWELYEEAHTPWEWHAPIFAAARAAGLACVSTAFDRDSAQFLLSLGVDAIKIASFELVHVPLLEVAAGSGRPVILSTGMATLAELDEAVATLRKAGCGKLLLLKCTSAYPSTEGDANLMTLEDMRRRFDCEVGLSDHSLRSHVACAATALGATVIEKHLTLARADGGPDSTFSIEPAELRALVADVDLAWKSLGTVRYGPLPAEAASLRERPSIYVVRPMKAGERFSEENLRIIRPANGLAPTNYRSLLGRPCACDIAAVTPLSWVLVQSGRSPAPASPSPAAQPCTTEYLAKNAKYWSQTYDAPNVESFLFRFYGRILKFDYGIDGSGHERLLDFGCGQGGAIAYFDRLGFDCHGVDIAANDIAAARRRLPHLADRLRVVDPRPDERQTLFDGGFDIVISIQTLDFLSNTDFAQAIKCLWSNMKPGGKIYASMNGWDMYYRRHGEYVGDGLWRVKFKTDRVDYDLYLNFVKDKEDMKRRFSLFKPVYLDHYDSSFREEGSEFRYTFFGIKE